MIQLRRRNVALPLGCVLLVLGFVPSGSLLELTIFPTGTIVGTARRAVVLMVCRVALAALGAYLVAVGPRITVVHLSALGLGGLFGGVVGAVFLQVGYVPPPIVSGWKAFAPAAEQNELGFRGRSIVYSPEDFVIVLLGDSQVEAMKFPFDSMPERLLESHLDLVGRTARVFSIGASGYGQDQELLGLQQYFTKYRADLVVLWQTPSNDIWNNLFKTHMATRNPKPTFWLDESGRLRGPSEGLGEPLANSRVVVAALFQRAFGLPWRDKSWERGLPEPYVPLTRHDEPVLTDWQDRWNANVGRMRDEELETEKSHLAVLLTPRSKRTQYGLDLTRALMWRIQELTTANHGRLVVLQTDSRDIPDGDRVYVLNQRYYRTSRAQYEANWRYVNKGFDTEIVPVTVRQWRVGREDAHLNAQATEQVMTDLAERLRSRISERRLSRASSVRGYGS